ncbi:hypothetical protein GIB67_011710, partial [Kingdonia uniflora]
DALAYRYILCHSSDFASECANPHDTRYYPEIILLYDKHRGGSGISAHVQPTFQRTSNYCFGSSDIVSLCGRYRLPQLHSSKFRPSNFISKRKIVLLEQFCIAYIKP